jgi:gluconolactonase
LAPSRDLEILYRGAGLLEAPRWDGNRSLYVTNVTLGGVHRFDVHHRTLSCVVPHRRGIGGLALTDSGFVVAGRNVALKCAGDDTTIVLLAAEQLGRTTTGFNDLTVDSSGAIVIGSLGPDALHPKTITGYEKGPPAGAGTGAVYRIDLQGHRCIAQDIGHPNGIALSPDQQFAYLSDTLRRVVYRYRVNADGWSHREIFFQPEQGMPDGLAVATDGSVWVALALGNQIAVLDERGVKQHAYAMPAPLTTSLAFAGPDMRTVYVTTGSHDDTDAAIIATFRAPVAGCVIPRAVSFKEPTC